MRSLLSALLLAGVACAQESGLPNVVLIIGDDQGWGDFGFMGSADIRTPHLDRLAEQGLVFPRGYVPTALCRASLASLVTGLYPHQHGLTGNDPPRGVDRARMLEHIARVDEELIKKVDAAAQLAAGDETEDDSEDEESESESEEESEEEDEEPAKKKQKKNMRF